MVHARSVVSNPLWPHGFLYPWNFPGKNGAGCHFFLQIFLTQGLNPCLLHWQGSSLPAEPPGEPTLARWVVFLKMVTIFCSFSIKRQHLFLHHLNLDLDMWLASIMGQEQTLHSQRLRKGLCVLGLVVSCHWEPRGHHEEATDGLQGWETTWMEWGPSHLSHPSWRPNLWEWDHLELSSPS